MSYNTPSTRHIKRLEIPGAGEEMIETTSNLGDCVIQAVRDFFTQLEADPSGMLKRSTGTGGPSLSNPVFAALEIKIHHPITDDFPAIVVVTSAAKVNNEDRVVFTTKIAWKPE